MIKSHKILLCLILTYSHAMKPVERFAKELIVYNVGQGLWVNYKTPSHCEHFDMGGERFPTPVFLNCSQKENRLWLSHWDQDHVNFIQKFHKKITQLCWGKKARFLAHKMNLGLSLDDCENIKNDFEIKFQIDSKKSNDLSRIYSIAQTIIPGDATTYSEKHWSTLVPDHNRCQKIKTKILILGHHGSKTSTSDHLLNQLKNLKMAVSSARQKKYGHPHHVIAARLKRHKISLIKTEDWGHLHFEVK